MSTGPGSRFRHGHWAKANRATLAEMRFKGAPSPHGDGYVTVGGRLEHIVVAERALGHQLPAGAVVHHVNEDRSDNRPCNLVICPDKAYHALLHQRMRAMADCGNPNWRRCAFCGRYDAPENLYIPPVRGTIEHRACGRAYRAARLKEKSC